MSKEEEKVDTIVNENASDSESDDDDDGVAVVLNQQDRGRRGTVMAAPVKVEASWSPPEYKKSIAEKESIKNTLVKNFLFTTLDDDQLEIVVKAMQRITFEKGNCILQQKDEGDLFYIVEDGECEVLVNDEVVAQVVGGTNKNYFGELALLYDAPRAATVIATSKVEGWALDRITFKMIIVDSTMKKRKLYEGFLNNVPILSTLSSHERSTVADALKPIVYDKGEVILEEGDMGEEFYLIEEGQVSCSKEGEKVLELNKGQYFGELSLLTDDVRKATVTADMETKCLLMNRTTFKRLLGPLEPMLRDNSVLYDKYVAKTK